MSCRTLLDIFRTFKSDTRRLDYKQSRVVLLLEAVEERLAPATLPTPTILTPTAAAASVAILRQDPAAANNNTTIDYINPQVVADPLNPLNQVMVASRWTSNANGTALASVTVFSTDGGQSWNPQLAGTLTPTALTRPQDPNIPPNPLPVPYTDASYPSVAFGRDGTVYYLSLAHNAAKTSGAVVFTKAAFGAVPGAPTVLYRWLNAEQALNPVIAVDNNTPTFTDPTTGATFTDPLVSAAG